MPGVDLQLCYSAAAVPQQGTMRDDSRAGPVPEPSEVRDREVSMVAVNDAAGDTMSQHQSHTSQ